MFDNLFLELRFFSRKGPISGTTKRALQVLSFPQIWVSTVNNNVYSIMSANLFLVLGKFL